MKKEKLWRVVQGAVLLFAAALGMGFSLSADSNVKTQDCPVLSGRVASMVEDCCAKVNPLELAEEAVRQKLLFPIVTSSPLTQNVEALFASEDIYCIYDGEKYLYIKQDGENLTGDDYTKAYPFYDGLACACKDGKYGFIDREGRTAVPFEYEDAAPFVEGLAYFSRDGRYGFMDRTGKPEFYLDCDSVSTFAEGLAYFSVGGRYGYIDKSGKTVIEPIYDDAEYFQDGLAEVVWNSKRGMIDKAGRLVIAPEYVEIEREESCILAQKDDDKNDIFDLEGNTLLKQPCDRAGVYMAGVVELSYEELEVSGFLYQEETFFFDGCYDFTEVIPEYRLVIAKLDKSYGVMDFQGEIKIPFCQTNIIYQDGTDVFLVSGGNHQCSIVSAGDFSQRMAGEYDSISSFLEGQAVVGKNDKYGVIDLDGNVVMPVSFEKIKALDNGSYWYRDESVSYLYDKNGNLLKEGDYIRISDVGSCYEVENSRYEEGFLDARGRGILGGYKYSYGRRRGDASVHLMDGFGDVIVKTGETEEEGLSDLVFCNRITPRAEKFWEVLENGSLLAGEHYDSVESGFSKWDGVEKVCKFYDFSHTGRPVLYASATPYTSHEMSSGFFTLDGEEVICLLSGYDGGGSGGGDHMCLWYDRVDGKLLYGFSGGYGGFFGFAAHMYVYDDTGGALQKRVDFECINQSAGNYSREELLQNARLYYEDEKPYTEETILDAVVIDEYSVNGELTTIERYREVEERYRWVRLLQ